MTEKTAECRLCGDRFEADKIFVANIRFRDDWVDYQFRRGILHEHNHICGYCVYAVHKWFHESIEEFHAEQTEDVE